MTRTNEPDFFLPERGALCAVSGGLDSMCLLTMAVQWGQAQGRRVAAAHFNHQLRGGDADRDERFVRDWCAAHAIPFFAGRGDVRAKAEREGLSVEEAARTLRYAFLEEVRQREGFDCILTAHHADDSAETMLLNLLRGTPGAAHFNHHCFWRHSAFRHRLRSGFQLCLPCAPSPPAKAFQPCAVLQP